MTSDKNHGPDLVNHALTPEMKGVAVLLKRLESGYSLPSLSIIAMKLVELASDERCTVEDLAALIETDPSLAVRLLRLANSAFFASGHQVMTLEQAIVRIGFHRLRIMGLSLSLRDTFPMGRVGPMDYEGFWRSSLYQALLAKSFADRLGICDPEEAFVAGLTQEIGFLILFDLLIANDQKPPSSLQLYPLETLLSWERDRYGVNHRQVGEAALRFWKFPETMIASQRLYGVEDRMPPLATVCELARPFSALICERTVELREPFPMAETFLGLDQELVGDVLMAVFHQVEQISDSLKLEVNRARDVMELLEKANRALGRLSEQLSMDQQPIPRAVLPSFQSLSHEGEQEMVIAETLEAVAHEIRNPLMAVGGFAKRLASQVDPNSEEGRWVRVILEETERVERTLLDMVRRGPRPI